MPIAIKTIIEEMQASIKKLDAHINYEKGKQQKESQDFRKTRIDSLVELHAQLQIECSDLQDHEGQDYNPMVMGTISENLKAIKILADKTKKVDMQGRKDRAHATSFLDRFKQDKLETGGKTAKCLDGISAMSTKLMDRIAKDLAEFKSSDLLKKEQMLGVDKH